MFEKPIPQEKLDSILSTLQIELEHLLGDQLDTIYLYGSQARHDARPDSDIDILVVLREDFNYFDMIEKTADITANLSLENDVVISTAFTTQYSFQHLNTPFLLNVHHEGIQL